MGLAPKRPRQHSVQRVGMFLEALQPPRGRPDGGAIPRTAAPAGGDIGVELLGLTTKGVQMHDALVQSVEMLLDPAGLHGKLQSARERVAKINAICAVCQLVCADGRLKDVRDLIGASA